MARGVARFNPFTELDAWEKRLFEGGWPLPWRGAKLPTTDVYTDDAGQLVVEAHLPGFSADDVSVSLDAGSLVIEAEHSEKETRNYIVRESSSSFHRRVDLPGEVSDEDVTATFDQGVLTVKVPFKAESEPRKIAVTRGATPEEPTRIEPSTS